jgi:energy-coupling factor transport system ATP-binding protein
MGIQFKHVNYTYQSFLSKDDALKDIDLSLLDQGEMVAICGHTGSGKSTLVQLMNGLLSPTSGKVIVFDTELPIKKGQKLNPIRKRVGLVFQFPEYQLFEETVLKDIMFGPLNFKASHDEALKKAKEAAKQVGIAETLLEQSPFRISGGQMRRVAIAGILAMEPDILILDEPTRGLDPIGQQELMDMLSLIHQQTKKTIIIISHDMNVVAKYAKRVIVMKEGKKVFDDLKTSLFEHPDFNTFHLELPETLKLMKYLSTHTNVPYKACYSEDALFKYLKEYSHA